MGTDREGFEPSIPLRAYRFSRPAVSTAHPPVLLGVFLIVRTGWDSNPRNGCPLTRFPSVRLKPLGHPSELLNADAKLIRPREAFYGPPCPGESVGGNRETARCEAPCTVRGARARTSATPQQDPAAVLSRRRRPAAL